MSFVRSLPTIALANFDSSLRVISSPGAVLVAPDEAELESAAHLFFDVTPPEALVYIDGTLIGSARSFSGEGNGFLIEAGEYNLRIEAPGHKPFEAVLRIIHKHKIHIDLQLEREFDGITRTGS